MLRLLMELFAKVSLTAQLLKDIRAALSRIETEQASQGRLLKEIYDSVTIPPLDVKFNCEMDGTPFKGVNSMDMTATQKFTATLEIKEKRSGAAALPEGVPEWNTSDATVAMVNPAADGLSAEVVAGGASSGSCLIVVTGDADAGAGVQPFSAQLEVNITGPGQAFVVALNAGAAVEQ